MRRTPLGPVDEVALPFELLPVPGERSVVVLSRHAGERGGWARRLDGATGQFGVILPLEGRELLGVFDGRGATEPPLWLTSERGRLCVSTYAEGATAPSASACAAVAPHAVVRMGSRLALLELAPRPRATATATRPGAREDAAHSAPARPRELRVRWATPRGIDAETHATGLELDEPLAGLSLVGARARPGDAGVDVLFYDRIPAPASAQRDKLGWARLSAGSLGPNGAFILASRATVLEGEITYGGLRDHHDVRLAGHGASLAVGLDAKGACEARLALAPTAIAVIATSRLACAIEPDRLDGGAASPAVLARIFAENPRVSPTQPLTDRGLVAWAGDRAYFLTGGARLRSADRATGESRAEPAPLVGRRARLAWSSFAPDGEGLAFADNHLVHVAVDGRVTRTPVAALAPQVGFNRGRAARIGGSWWTADGDVLRLLPTVRSPPHLRGRANRDGTALVGGERGLFLELRGGFLWAHALDREGALTPLGEARSAVRAGFDACERRQGGALLAGVSADDPTRLVALALDRDGKASAPIGVSAAIAPGVLRVHLAPRPGGGAWLTLGDADSGTPQRVVWLDDDARPEGEAELPAAPERGSPAPCLDGRHAPRVPSPTPGALVALPGLAEADACLVGDVAWTGLAAARWFGSATRGLDAIPELGVARLPDTPDDSPRAAAPAAPPPLPASTASARPRCPGDMVSIAARFCIDRFEAHLVDAPTREALSPDYPLAPAHLARALSEWTTGRRRVGDVHAQALSLPFLPAVHASGHAEPLARSEQGARPSGYVSGVVAEAACLAAGKRLCTRDEHRLACRGEQDTAFPYGFSYIEGACNVFRAEHPAAKLHGNASVGHLDPRLNRVESRGEPLLRATGATRACRSVWGADAVYDLVGNLDEWVADRGGPSAFVGGFYARSTRAGCGATVSAHPRSYADYSTGVRCCSDATSGP